MSPVPSTAPSSTTTISRRSGRSATRRRTSSIVRASLYAGTRTLTRGSRATGRGTLAALALEALAQLAAPAGGHRPRRAAVGQRDAVFGGEVEQRLALLALARG